MKQRRWGSSSKADENAGCLIRTTELLPSIESDKSQSKVAPKDMFSASVYADQLFGGSGPSGISYGSRKDLAASMSEKSLSILTSKLRWDSYFLRESCVYIPRFVTDDEAVPLVSRAAAKEWTGIGRGANRRWQAKHADAALAQGESAQRDGDALRAGKAGQPQASPTLYELIWLELGSHFERSKYRRSRHPAILEFEVMRGSETYMYIRRRVQECFSGLDIGYSIVNLYRDAGDLTEFHRDNFMADGNRQFEDGEDEGDEVSAWAHHVL